MDYDIFFSWEGEGGGWVVLDYELNTYIPEGWDFVARNNKVGKRF